MVGAAVNNLLRVGGADTGQGIQLFLRGGIDVHQIAGGRD